MSVPRFSPLINDEAIARSLQYQEQETESARQAQESRDATLAASLAEPAGSGAVTREASDAQLAASLAQPAGAPMARAVAVPLPASAPYAANLQCREGCALTPFSASPHQRVQCDRCGQRIIAGRHTLSCLAHDYDVCEACAAAPSAPRIVQGRVLPSPQQGAVQGQLVHRARGNGLVGERAVAGPTGVRRAWS